MSPTYRKILVWLVSFGKTKSGIIFFLLVIATYFILVPLFVLLHFLFEKLGYPNLVSGQIEFGFPIFLFIVLEPWNFYKRTIVDLATLRDLENKGLTPEDIDRITSVKTWEKTRSYGIKKFCLYNGGVTAGIILTIPLGFIILLIGSYFHLISGSGGMITFSLLAISSGYLSGVTTYYIRWKHNEQKFIRFTDPLH